MNAKAKQAPAKKEAAAPKAPEKVVEAVAPVVPAAPQITRFRSFKKTLTLTLSPPVRERNPATGEMVTKVASRWRQFANHVLALDTQNPEDVIDIDLLRQHPRYGHPEFFLEVKPGESGAELKDEGKAIGWLFKQDRTQILTMFSTQELEELDLTVNATSEELIAGFLRLGKTSSLGR